MEQDEGEELTQSVRNLQYMTVTPKLRKVQLSIKRCLGALLYSYSPISCFGLKVDFIVFILQALR